MSGVDASGGADPRWDEFLILVSAHPAGPDARRVVFERRDPADRDAAGRPASVVLGAGGDAPIWYVPPAVAVPGVGRADFVRKAVEVVRLHTDQ